MSRPPPSPATRHASAWRIAVAVAAALAPAAGAATPTGLFWAPSSRVQRFAVPHLAYDTYFWPGSSRAASYPVTIGLTTGVLPLEKVQLEIGFDVVVPTRDPLFLNAKVGVAEDAMFAGSPAVAVGVYEVGVSSATALDVVYAVAGKRTPLGSIELGGYLGSGRLLLSSSGSVRRAGVLAGVALPALEVNRTLLQRIEVRWDAVTGRNAIGATGGGVAFVVAPWVSVLTGPIFFLDPSQHPGATGWLWSVHLDVGAAAAQAPAAPSHAKGASGSRESRDDAGATGGAPWRSRPSSCWLTPWGWRSEWARRP